MTPDHEREERPPLVDEPLVGHTCPDGLHPDFAVADEVGNPMACPWCDLQAARIANGVLHVALKHATGGGDT